MNQLRISHLLFKVDDLHEAVRQARSAGFTCEYGSEPATAHNALIWFETGPFLEILSPSRAASRAPVIQSRGAAWGERFERWSRTGIGWRDWALETDDTDLTAVASALKDAGFDPMAPVRTERTLTSAEPVSWWLTDTGQADLPFIMSAYSSPQRPSRVDHPNGAIGVNHIVIEAPDTEDYASRIALLLPPEHKPEIRAGQQYEISSVSISGISAGIALFGQPFVTPAKV